ncbi:hypothetical protein GCM10023235_63570 [Kitasatospora terrestris]|uniref:Uncharacterized protein n=1 Tax=Kitasatospora terrestris TaxID=258051 RepID=A0ABP9EDM5_9ACTN
MVSIGSPLGIRDIGYRLVPPGDVIVSDRSPAPRVSPVRVPHAASPGTGEAEPAGRSEDRQEGPTGRPRRGDREEKP